MKRYFRLIILNCLIMCAFINAHEKNTYQNVELISTINSMNREYCSIIIHSPKVKNKMELALVLIDSCRENSFNNIKFATDIRGCPSSLSLNVYLTEKDFKSGKQYMNVRYEMIDLNKKSNIKDDMENYQLYIDDELIEEYHCS